MTPPGKPGLRRDPVLLAVRIMGRGWCTLADLGKYVRRGSAWDALKRLNEARAQLWRLWAATRGVPQSQYGLTSVLDYLAGIPDGIEQTICDLDSGRLLAASLRGCSGRPTASWGEEQRAALPSAMGRFVIRDLETCRTARALSQYYFCIY
jgi:hypothetical protein